MRGGQVNPLSDRARSDDGYRLWLRYEPLEDSGPVASYRALLGKVHCPAESATLQAAAWELDHALQSVLREGISFVNRGDEGRLVVGTPESNSAVRDLSSELELGGLGREGFVLRTTAESERRVIVAANSELGVLYGVFALLRVVQQRLPLDELAVSEKPRLRWRMLNHWDNLDRTIERGYAGSSLWDWHKLPHYVAPRYTDYARLNASVGINAVALTNVNANALVLTPYYLEKVRALAEVFRPYGIRVFLTARFSAPSEIGGLATSDPGDPGVVAWWQSKADEIYRMISDFGGFVVKADSEGQPGPQDYGRSQAEGANALAAALAPHGGIVVWRAFVYDDAVPEDRHKQAYDELVPLDGQFRPNACLQAKNGPIDFQPREPFHPLFGAMPKTPLFLEFQLTQEYLGFATHLAYLGPLFKETLEADTYAHGEGSTVESILAAPRAQHDLTGMAGVSNVGDERNWCGHPFAAANWYAFARLCWDPALGADVLADEWLRMTFTTDPEFVETAKHIMLESREAVVEYMTPLGLHHLMARSHHYGPGPWVTGGARADWTSTYYHQADREGIGFDRTLAGSGALQQYRPEVRARYETLESCPLQLLLWFHHVRWEHVLPSGRTLWVELCHLYTQGVSRVAIMRSAWSTLRGKIDSGRFDHVSALLDVQLREAQWWRDACLLYFQTFSGLPFPNGLQPPRGTLTGYAQHQDYFVPGI